MKKIMTILLSLMIVAAILVPSVTPAMAHADDTLISESTGEVIGGEGSGEVPEEGPVDEIEDTDSGGDASDKDDSSTEDKEGDNDGKNDEEVEEEEKVTITELPKSLLGKFKVNLPRDGFVIEGDEIRIQITVNAKVETEGFIRIADEEVEVRATQGLFTTKIEAMYTVSQIEDGEIITIDFSELRLIRKISHNIFFGTQEETIIYTMKEYGQEIENRVPFDIEKDFLEVEAVSSNENGPKIAKTGDRVTLTIRTEKAVEITDAQIEKSVVSFETEDGMTHRAEAVFPESESIEDLKLYFSVYHPHTDTTSARIEKFTGIRYLEALWVEDAKLTEISGKNAVKSGDTVILRACLNHEAAEVSLEIGGRQVPVLPGKMILSQTVMTDYPDQEKIGYVLTARDAAGNETRFEESDCITFFAPIEIVDLNAVSSNASENYLKDTDSVTVSFKTNHTVQASMSILDTTQEGAGKSFEISREINGLTDLSPVGYRITLIDAAGNTAIAQADPFVYMAPLTGGISVSHDYSKTEGYLKEGDSITFNVTANHDMTLGDVTVAETGAASTGNTVAVTMGAEHAEGEVRFNGVIRDTAGNSAVVNLDSGIVYDRTVPVLSMDPVENVFSSEDMVVRARITDSNLDPNDVTFMLNGETKDAATHGNESEAVASFTIIDEGEHVISATASDLAGNEAECPGERIIIDKTNPKVTLIRIDARLKPVYKSGIRLSDMVSVSDQYIKSIEASITAASGAFGSMSVGMDEALTDEGLMNAEISSNDMAGNESKKLTFSFYIDGTAPKPILTVRETKKMIDTDEIADLKAGQAVTIDLDEIWMGESEADELTKLDIVTVDGEVQDVLGNANPSEREITINSDTRKIVLSAKDSVGNETGEIVYQVKVKETGASGLFGTELNVIRGGSDVLKTGIKAGILSAILSVVAGVAAIVLIRKKRMHHDE